MPLPTPQRCTKCPGLQDRPDYTKNSWLQACSKHGKAKEKVETLSVLLNTLERQVRAAEKHEKETEVRTKAVDLQISIPLPDGEIPLSMADATARYKTHANEIADRIFAQTKWRFVYKDTQHNTGTGPRIRFVCAEDEREARERSGKPAGKDGHVVSKRNSYPCKSDLSFNYNCQSRFIRIILKHHHLHETYEEKRLSTTAKQAIAERVQLGGGKAGDIMAELRGTVGRLTGDQCRSHVKKVKETKRGPESKQKPDESDVDHVKRLAPAQENLDLLELVEVEDWESVAFSCKPFEKEASVAKEFLYDGTHGLTKGGWELLVALAESNSHSYPVAFLFLRPSAACQGKHPTKASRASRLRLIEAFLTAVKKKTKCSPSISHVDKDFSEISALESVFAGMKLQICLWHSKKSLTRRLRAGPNTVRVSYSAEDVAIVIPSVDRSWFPAKATAPKRVGKRSPPSQASISGTSCTLPAPEAEVDPVADPQHVQLPWLVLSAKSREKYLGSLNFPADILREMAPPEDGDEDDEDVDEEGRRWIDGEERDGRTDGDAEWPSAEVAGVAEGATGSKQGEGGAAEEKRKRGSGKGKVKGETLGIARTQHHLDCLITLLMDHYSYHSLIPYKDGRNRIATAIYRESAREMYQYCYQNDLRGAWGYLWNSWYRPGRWNLWARSTYHEIPVYRTTMGAEAFFGRLKNHFVGKQGRRDLLHIVEVLNHKTIPWLLLNVTEHEKAHRTLDSTAFKSAFRKDFTAEHRKVYEREWKRRQAEMDARAKNAGVEPVMIGLRSASRSRGVQLFPPLLPAPNPILDPHILGIDDPLSPAPNQHHTRNGACSCISFLRSRFLQCKHTILASPPSVIGDGTPEDQLLWFKVVERQRTAPFWQVTHETISRAIKKKAGVVEGVARERRALPEGDESAKEEDAVEDEVDEGDWDGLQEFGGGFDDDDEGRERVEGNGMDIGEEGEQEEISGEGLVFHSSSAAAAASSEEEDDPPNANVDMAKWDELKAKKRAILQARVENGADRRYMEKVLKRERRELSKLEKEGKEVGKGGRGAKRRKKRSSGDESGGETFY